MGCSGQRDDGHRKASYQVMAQPGTGLGSIAPNLNWDLQCRPDSTFCPGGAIFLTSGSPGPGARAPQPACSQAGLDRAEDVPGWQANRRGGCRHWGCPMPARDRAAARPCMALAGQLSWRHPLAGLALPARAARAPNHGNQSCQELVD